MGIRNAFLVQSLRILPILLLLIYSFAPEPAVGAVGVGGGGGHFGGHFGGGHSSSGQSSEGHSRGHFGWLRLGFGKHAARHGLPQASSTSEASFYPARLWTQATSASTASISRSQSTLLWSPKQVAPKPFDQLFFASPHCYPHRPGFGSNRFGRFVPSGCFFNGFTQVCFFEPFWPLISFGAYFDFSDWGFGFGGGTTDLGDNPTDLGWQDMSAVPPSNSFDNDATDEYSSVTAIEAADRNLDSGVFILVLKNGTRHAVTNYWVADGYLEYVDRGGERSHIPLEALDLEATVNRNAPRGLPFVLRSPPAENR
jgi:hypothetical protein